MAEVIDTLTALPDKAPYFEVDTEADPPKADLQLPENPEPYFVNASGQNRFRMGDNFTLLSAGIFIPYQFQPYITSAAAIASNRLKIQLEDMSGNVYNLPELGSASMLHIPIENYETGLGIFVNVLTKTIYGGTTLLSGDFLIRYEISGLSISLMGIPTPYADMIIPVFPYVKVLHNFPMETGSYPVQLVANFTWEAEE